MVLGWTVVATVGVAVSAALPTPVGHAVVTPMTCFTAADGGDSTVTVDIDKDDQNTATDTDDTYTSSNETDIGALGVPDVESVAMRPGGTTLYTADGGQLGTINQTTGVFTAIGTGLGTSTDSVTYNGSTGTFSGGQTINFNTLDDIDGLTFDHFTQKLWGIVRIAENGVAPAEYDQLVVIDPATGAFEPQQFRNPGDTTDVTDTVPVTPPSGGPDDVANIGDIDDIAIDPRTGTLYGVANAAGANDQLVTINKSTGEATIIGSLGVTDVEGMGFSNVGGLFGEFFATTGDSSIEPTEADSFWRIDADTGSVVDENGNAGDGFTPIHEFTSAGNTDYESMDCLVSSVITRQVTGFVYRDDDKDGVYEPGDGEAGIQDASVRLYIDNNGDNLVDGGDTFVDNVFTANGTTDDIDDDAAVDDIGFYAFTVAFPDPTPLEAPRNFVLDVDTASLPGGHITTDFDDEEASFPGSPASSDDGGSTNGVPNTDGSGNNVNNNFGFVTAPDISKTSDNVTAPSVTDPVLPGTDTIEYEIVIENTADNDITADIDVTDTLPAGLTYTGTSNSTLGDPNDLTIVETPDGTVGTAVTPTFLANGEFETGSLGIRLDRLDAGHTITITFRVTTSNASIASGTITNEACRLYQAVTICDSESDSVVGSIGDFLWDDLDEDGVQDGGGEVGIGGIDVRLLTSGDDGDCTDGDEVLVDTVQTDAGGNYSFARLGTDEYCVDPVQTDPDMPDGYVITNGPEPVLRDLDVSAAATRIFTNADFGYASAPVIDVELTKQVSDGVGAFGDSVTAGVGDNVTFRLEVSNNAAATDTATGVAVTDVLPAGLDYVSDTGGGDYDDATGVWTVGSLAVGASETLDIVAQVTNPGPLTNDAQVTAATGAGDDSTPNNMGADPVEDDEADAEVLTAAAPPPATEPSVVDIELTKDVSQPTVEVGDEFSFTIAVENVVPGATATAMNVAVTDQLPDGLTFVSASASKGSYDPDAGKWQIGPLRRSERQTLLIVVRADAPGIYENVAYVSTASGDDIDSAPGVPNTPFQDDEDSAVVEAGMVDLELTKSVSDDTVVLGQEFTFDVTVENVAVADSAALPATNVSVQDTLPEGLRFVRVASTNGDFDPATFIWFVGDLDVGSSATLTLVVTAERGGTFVNIAQVIGCDQVDIDSKPANDEPGEDDQDEASVAVEVTGAIGDFVWLDRNGDGIQDPDETGLAGVFVALAGPFDSRPSSPGAIEADTVLQTDDDGEYLFEELEPGLYIVVSMEDTVPEGLNNTIGTNWYEVQIDPGGRFMSADFGYQPTSVGLSIVKTVSPSGLVSFGDECVYTITVSNTGSDILTNVVVEDTAPEGTTYRPGTTALAGEPVPDASSTAAPMPLDPQNGGIALGDLAPGQSRRITFGVTVDLREPREIPNVASVTSDQTGKVGSNRVVIEPAASGGVTLPATGGPVDRLLLLGFGAIGLGGVTLVSVRGPSGSSRPPDPGRQDDRAGRSRETTRRSRRRRRRRLRSHRRPAPQLGFFTAHGGFERPPRRYRR